MGVKWPDFKNYLYFFNTLLNTEICEQLFVQVNEHKNVKSMNESRFFLFWLYQMHLHNLDIEGLASVMSNPQVEFRWDQIKIIPVNYENLSLKLTALDASEAMEKLNQSSNPAHKCPLCEEVFGEEAELSAHISRVHPETHPANPRECKECGKILGSAQSLTRHITSIHRTCKTCKMLFETADQLQQHKTIHTTCQTCGKDCGFPSKLKAHMESHK